MKIVVFAFIIVLTVSTVAQDLNTGIPYEGTHTQSEHAVEKKTARDENSGTCGGNLKWVFNEKTSTLTISGQGNMSCFSSSSTPWSHLSNKVQAIEIKEGVSSIDQYAFKSFSIFEECGIHIIECHINRKQRFL